MVIANPFDEPIKSSSVTMSFGVRFISTQEMAVKTDIKYIANFFISVYCCLERK